MTTIQNRLDVPREGASAPFVRLFGWANLTLLAALLIDNILVVGFNFPAITTAFSGGTWHPWLRIAIYLAALVVAASWVMTSATRSLRWDGKVISDFNAYLVRACFWAVLLVGIADATIAFVRVEKFLPLLLNEELAQALGRARFVGPYIHIPLIGAGFVIALFTRTLGFHWLALLIVVAELAIVISRFVFSYEQALMGDLVRYWYAALFLFASAHTLLDEGHVRVDVLYAGFDSRRKGKVNGIGAILFGMSTCWVIIAIGFAGKQSIINSPVANFEVSQTGNVGMFIKYQMAMFLGVFAITMLIQFVSYMFEGVADMRGEPGQRDHNAPMH